MTCMTFVHDAYMRCAPTGLRASEPLASPLPLRPQSIYPPLRVWVRRLFGSRMRLRRRMASGVISMSSSLPT